MARSSLSIIAIKLLRALFRPILKLSRLLSRWAALLCLSVAIGVGLWQLVAHPNTPLPDIWNPWKPLRISDPLRPITNWKLRIAANNPEICKSVLSEAAIGFQDLPDLSVSAQCGIDGRVNLSSASFARLTPLETSCAIALRLAMWDKHGVQPASVKHFGTSVSEIRHLSSFNCRPMRVPGGAPRGMSTHATAEAIDIAGFLLADGRQIDLLSDWNGAPDAQAFLRDVRDTSCRWFATTLGPDYNTLHRDHFHLQSRGWGTCR